MGNIVLDLTWPGPITHEHGVSKLHMHNIVKIDTVLLRS